MAFRSRLVTVDMLADGSITDAKIASISASKITTGTLSAHTITVAATGSIQSAGYPADPSWQLSDGGLVVVGGTIAGGTVNATDILGGSIAATAITATSFTGGTITATTITATAISGGTIDGTTITGGTFRTASSGARVELTGTDASDVTFYDSGGTARAKLRWVNLTNTLSLENAGTNHAIVIGDSLADNADSVTLVADVDVTVIAPLVSLPADVYVGPDGYFWSYVAATDILRWRTAGSILVEIDSAGRLYSANTRVGTSVVHGTSYAEFAYNNGGDYSLLTDGQHTFVNAPGNPATSYVWLRSQNGTFLTGRLVGTQAEIITNLPPLPPDQAVHITAGSRQLFQSTSSRTHKWAIADLAPGPARLRPRAFRWQPDVAPSGRFASLVDHGFVADEVHALAPALASLDDTGTPRAIRFDALVAYLAAGVYAELDDHASALRALAARVDALDGNSRRPLEPA